MAKDWIDFDSRNFKCSIEIQIIVNAYILLNQLNNERVDTSSV